MALPDTKITLETIKDLLFVDRISSNHLLNYIVDMTPYFYLMKGNVPGKFPILMEEKNKKIFLTTLKISETNLVKCFKRMVEWAGSAVLMSQNDRIILDRLSRRKIKTIQGAAKFLYKNKFTPQIHECKVITINGFQYVFGSSSEVGCLIEDQVNSRYNILIANPAAIIKLEK